MKGPLSNKIRVHHILDAIAEVKQYIAGVTEKEFLNNSEKRFATIKQIEIIGEACNKITEELRLAHPHTLGAGNRIPEYFHSRISQHKLLYSLEHRFH